MVENEEIKIEKKRDKLYWIKFFSGIGLAIAWLTLIIIKITKEETNLNYAFIILGILTFIFLLSFVAKSIVEKMNKKEKEVKPEPINEEEVMRLLYKTIEGSREKDYKDGYFRNIESVGQVKTPHVNQNLEYYFEVKLSGEIEIADKKTDKVIVIINATYPNIKPSVLPINLEEERIKEEINMKSSDPLEQPDEEKRVERDLHTGKETVYSKKIQPKKEIKEEKSGDVLWTSKYFI